MKLCFEPRSYLGPSLHRFAQCSLVLVSQGPSLHRFAQCLPVLVSQGPSLLPFDTKAKANGYVFCKETDPLKRKHRASYVLVDRY